MELDVGAIAGGLVLWLVIGFPLWAGLVWMLRRPDPAPPGWNRPEDPPQRDPWEGPGAFDPRDWRHPPGRG